MGHDHDHGDDARRAGERYRPRLVAAFLLTLAFVGVQGAAAVWSGSLALLSDAAHMLTDTAGLGMALAAITLASRVARSGSMTYGLYRVEVLAALLNSALLIGVAVYVMIEALHRFRDPVAVSSTTMLVVAGIGLVVNLVAVLLLRGGAEESLNLRAAYNEVLADAAGSVAVLVGAVVIGRTGWTWVDPALGIAIGLWIVPRTVRLGRLALQVLLQGAPVDVDLAEVQDALLAVPGVHEVHDLHAWVLTSDMFVASVHLVVTDDANWHGVLDQARDVMGEHRLQHATVQIEPTSHVTCREVDW